MRHANFDAVLPLMVNERRRHRRIKVLLVVDVQGDDRLQSARLTELSREGARVQPATPMQVGTFMVIRRGGVALKARVAWSRDHDAGLQFDDPMDEQSFLRLRRG